jgi:heat shock protein HtpX
MRGYVIGKGEVEEGYNWFSLAVVAGAIAACILGYVWLISKVPQSLRYLEWVGIAFGFLAFSFILTSVGKNHVKWYRWLATWAQSWVAFIAGLVIMAAFWYACYWTLAKYAPGYVVYFKWGAYITIPVISLLLIFNEPLVRFTMGAKRIARREDCPALWDAVEKVTPWHARPMPRVYLIPTRDMNAISFGWGLPGFSAVGATEGLLNGLNQNELEAVMAHEIGHIINKDILISMVLAAVTMFIATTGWLIWRLGPWAGESKSSSNDNNSGGIGALVIALAIGGVMYGFGRLLGYVIQVFVSRQREYAADATSARIMGTGQPLKSALIKVVRNAGLGSEKAGMAFGFMCTADPEPGDALDTHPSLEKRLRALDQLEA